MDNLVEKYKITDRQIKAIKEVEKALKKCQKEGLCAFGKQWDLVFYNREVFSKKLNSIDKGNIIIPHYSIDNILYDSGADDTEYFKNT